MKDTNYEKQPGSLDKEKQGWRCSKMLQVQSSVLSTTTKPKPHKQMKRRYNNPNEAWTKVLTLGDAEESMASSQMWLDGEAVTDSRKGRGTGE